MSGGSRLACHRSKWGGRVAGVLPEESLACRNGPYMRPAWNSAAIQREFLRRLPLRVARRRAISFPVARFCLMRGLHEKYGNSFVPGGLWALLRHASTLTRSDCECRFQQEHTHTRTHAYAFRGATDLGQGPADDGFPTKAAQSERRTYPQTSPKAKRIEFPPGEFGAALAAALFGPGRPADPLLQCRPHASGDEFHGNFGVGVEPGAAPVDQAPGRRLLGQPCPHGASFRRGGGLSENKWPKPGSPELARDSTSQSAQVGGGPTMSAYPPLAPGSPAGSANPCPYASKRL